MQYVQKLAKLLACYTGDFTSVVTLMYTDSLHISLVRPHLEYTCHVWVPHTSKDINELENVQKYVCKTANCQWNGVQYNQLLSITNLPSLEGRRTE